MAWGVACMVSRHRGGGGGERWAEVGTRLFREWTARSFRRCFLFLVPTVVHLAWLPSA